MKTEKELQWIATMADSDEEAGEAMKELRERFDPTYFYCCECDGMATKESECCLNINEDENSKDR